MTSQGDNAVEQTGQPEEPGQPDGPLVTRAELTSSFAQLGVQPGDTVLMHSSLKSLGRMDGGADGVIDALLAAVGLTGHVLMPTHTGCHLRNEGPSTLYDPATTPSKTGLITEVFRQRPGALRSGHPTHSVAAMGPEAELLVSGHGPSDGRAATFNIHGPHGRYVRWGGKIIFLGIGLMSNTTYHAVEEWLALPYLPDRAALIAKSPTPQTVTIDSPLGHRNFYRNSGLNLPNPVTATIEQRGLIRHVMLNQTELQLVHSRDVIRVTTECELATPGALLCRQDGCHFCQLARYHCILQRDHINRLGQELLRRPEMCDPTQAKDRD